MVVDIGPKNTTNEDAHRSEWRSALISSLTEPTLLEMYGKGVISNDADRFKRFYSYFFCARTHLSHCTRIASLGLRCFTCVTLASSGRFRFIDSVLPTKHLFGHDRP